MRPSPFVLMSLTALAGLAGGIPAQAASWTAFGSGCAGGERVCFANNPYGGGLTGASYGSIRQLALQVDIPVAMTITGFDFFTQAAQKGTTTAYLYAATTSGAPGGVLAFGTMTCDVFRGWQGLRLAKPVALSAGQRVFLSWQVQSAANPPFALPQLIRGTTTPAWYLDTNGSWQNNWAPQTWSWRLVQAPQVPSFAIQGLPRSGLTHELRLGNVSAGALVMCLTGASNIAYGPLPLPFDMAPLGAAGCKLGCSIELASPMNADMLGNAGLKVPLPGDTSLLGLSYHQQWMVVDPGANAFGINLSNGGTARIGT